MVKTFRNTNLLFLACATLFILSSLGEAQEISIIPKPVAISIEEGAFCLQDDTVIAVDENTKKLGALLAGMLRPATGFNLRVTTDAATKKNVIELKLVKDLNLPGKEGYILHSFKDRITITGATDAGVFYGLQTLLQLLPAEIYGKEKILGHNWSAPCVKIEDYPRFVWRGAMLDVCRYFLPKEFILKFIDLLAIHKMNRFHLHLTEDQGWRIEIKKYPKLTQIGAWRDESLIGHYSDKPHKFDGKRHGGFYTQDDIKQIVAYAESKHITIVPEIEMPGHAQAAIAAYPELGNRTEQLPVRTIWGVNENIFNAEEETIIFLQDVLEEVLSLFPGDFIHIGGDEARKTQWKKSLKAQARIKELGLNDEDELQSYFIGRMDSFLNKKGRRLIGWDEILEGGLAQNATVMSWRGDKGGILAARAGHDVVMAPTHSTYFDYCQGQKENEPLAIGGYLPLQNVYRFEPVPKELTKKEARHILGAQGQIWTEYIPTPEKAEYMGFPRITALSEVVWSKKEGKDYNDFINRLREHLSRLDMLGVNYRPLDESTIIFSWKSGDIKETFQEIEADITGHITEAGDYEIVFQYTGGKHRLDIEWTQLVENEIVIVKDDHPGFTGANDKNNSYFLSINNVKKGRSYILKAWVKCDGGDDSKGDILLKRISD